MQKPSIDTWLKEAKESVSAGKTGMYLMHNGVIRATSKASLSDKSKTEPVLSMQFSYDEAAVSKAIENASRKEGISIVKVWLNSGTLSVGDDLMYVLVGGDCRPNVFPALQELVKELKTSCVTEKEIF